MSASIRPPLPYEVLYWINKPGLTAFRLRFRKVHAFTWTKAQYLGTPDHPLVPMLLKRYALREEIPLWWTCITQREGGHTDRVVRSWLARRTRNAFTESLRKKGFDTDGRRLPGSGNKADLFGTASIAVQRAALKVPYAELVKQTDIAVSSIQDFQQRQDSHQNKTGNGQKRGNQRNGRGRGRLDLNVPADYQQ